MGLKKLKTLKIWIFHFITHYSIIPSFHKRGKSKNSEKVPYLQYVIEIPRRSIMLHFISFLNNHLLPASTPPYLGSRDGEIAVSTDFRFHEDNLKQFLYLLSLSTISHKQELFPCLIPCLQAIKITSMVVTKASAQNTSPVIYPNVRPLNISNELGLIFHRKLLQTIAICCFYLLLLLWNPSLVKTPLDYIYQERNVQSGIPLKKKKCHPFLNEGFLIVG